MIAKRGIGFIVQIITFAPAVSDKHVCDTVIYHGEVLERLKRRAWKVRILHKGIAGSNPALSAELTEGLILSLCFCDICI